MEKYTVKIQNQEIEVWAKNHKSAMKRAIKKDTGIDFVFAQISTVLRNGDKEEEELLFSIDYLIDNEYFKDVELKKFE